ncbi:MAG: AMP-binding protein [Rhodocyclaceae bacterium]|nr:AMP-binding protein [Rhodocyclaceae bacterium]
MLTFPKFTPTFPPTQWTLPTLLEHQARVLGDRPFLKWDDDGPEYSFEATNRRANRLARGLAGLGIDKGDSAVLFLPNSLDYLFAWFALNKLGAIEVPINTAYKGRFLEHQVNISKAETLIADIDFADVVRDSLEAMPHLRRIVLWSRHGRLAEPLPTFARCEVVQFADLFAADESDPGIRVMPHDIAGIMFTSGTTGLSKGVMMPHAQHTLFAEINVQGMEMTADDVYMSGFPMFHVNAQLLTVYPCLIVGARCVLYERFSATQWVDRLHSSGATVTNHLGGVLPFVFAQPPTSRDNTHCLRRIGGGPTPYAILDAFKKRFGVERFVEYFGQTEVCLPIMTPLARSHERPVGAAGLLLDQWFDVRLVAPDSDEEVPVGQVGELMIRHKTPWTLNAGYVGMPDKTVEAWRNLWFHTGDGVRRDEQGWYYYVDRLKDALRRRGENISSYEVERPIAEHPAVAEVAVVAVPADMDGGEDEVKACVILKPGQTATPEELFDWCLSRLPGFAVPRYIELVGQFPRTPSEKVQKNILRAAGVTAATWDRVQAGRLTPDEARRAGRKLS